MYFFFWSLCCLFFLDIQILITPMVSFGHCVVCSSLIYRFWLHLWYLLVIVLSVLLWYTDSDYTYGIFWSLCCLFFFDIQILITPMASFGHCVVCSSLIYRFWLHLWYLLVIVLSVLLWYTDSDYTYGIFWSLCCLFFDIQILITPMVSFGHCVVCSSLIYRFWLHLWHLLVIVLSVLWYTDSDYTYGIFWSLCCLFFFDIQILITPMVSFGHCVVCSSLIYRFWLHLWHLLVIVLSVLLWYTDSDYTYGIFWSLCCLFFFDIDSDYTYGIFWSLCCLFFFDIQILITPRASFGHCVVCSSLIYRFWLHLGHLLVIVLSVLWYTDSDYTYGIFWSLCCLFFFVIQILITPMVSFGHCVVCSSLIYRFWLHLWHLLVIVLSVLLCYTDSDYTYGIFWSLCCLFFFDIQILITPMASFGHCVVCSSLIYRFWLHLWHLLVIVLSVLLWYTDSDYTYGIFWSLCCLFFFDIQILITPMASFGHCVVCSSLIYRFWLHLWYLLVIVLSVLLWYTDSDYTYGIFWSLCCLFFFDIQILITPMASFGHCVVCSSLIYRFWLHLWHLLVIVLSVLLWYTDSDYTYGIFWSLCCLFFFDIQILITPMASFGHCVVCSSLIYRFWLHLWHLLVIVLSVLWYTDSDYTYGIFWSLCCLFFFVIQILITPMASFGHCVVCSSLIYRFWLHLWHLLVIVLSVLWYTDSDYTYGIFWSLCCLFFFDIQILITPMVSFGHCVVCSSLLYRFWLHLWHLLVIVLSVLLWYTDSDYTYGIFWSLCCLFFFDIQILITPMVSFGHCVVCSSLIYRFWLHLWHLLVIVLSVLLWYTDSDYTYGIFWSLCCLFFFDIQILITPMASFGHCVVCSSLIYRFWLHLWYLLVIVLSVLLWYTDSDYTYGIFWSLCCLFFFDIQILITPMVSFGHCVVCSSLIYRFWLHLWYLLVIVLSVLLWYTDSDYTYGIFWSLCCLFFFDIQILITPMASFGHCVVCSSLIYRFWLHLWHLLVIVLSVLWYTDSDYTYGIFWSLCCLFFFDIQILITPMASFGHCVVCSSLIYRFWLHLWYLLVIVLSVLLWYTDSDYTYGIFWSLCCLFFDIQILITPMASFGHCVVCSSLLYRFWLHLWHLLVIVLSVLLWYTDSDYTYGIFWSLCCLFFFDIQILITPMASFGHCVVCSSLIYRFWLHLWHLLVIVLSVLLWYTDSDYTYGIFWSLCCLFFFDIQILITPMASFGHCVVCSSLIYRFWLHLWYLLVIVLSVLLWYTDSDYTYGIFWSLCCLFFFDIQILITPMASFGHCVVCSLIYRFWLHLWHLLVIVLSVLLWYTDSDYTYGIFWSLCCLFFFDIQILITPMASFGHCVVCSSLIYRFWLHLWHLLVIVLSVLLWYTDSDYTYGIFWSLCCLFFFDIQILITPMASFGHCVVCSTLIYRFWLHLWHLLVIVLSVLLWYTDSDYTYGIFWSLCCLFFFDIQILITPMVSFGHCVVCSSLIYRFWLHLWHLLVIVLSVLLWYTDSDYTYGIFWSLCCLFFDIQILITPMASFGHCVVCSSLIYRFWLHLWHLLVIVLSVLLWYTDSDYTYGIFWSLCCLFFFDIQILITPMVSFGHCVVCSSLIYRFWLHLWYLLVIVLSVLLWYTDSDYTYGIFWSLCCLFFFDIQILITPMASFGHCVVCSSLIYRFWLHLWHLLVIVLSVLLWYTDSDYTYGIFWSLCCLFFFDIQILITPMASFGHCVVCSSLIYRFWLHLWHLLVIVLSVLLWYTDSDYTYGIFWSLCCLFFFDIQILITPMVSFGHCVVCSSLIYRFWLHLWHLLVIVLSVLLWYTDSDYTYGIFWSLCCLFFFDIQILITPMVSFGHCVVCSSLIYRFWLHLWYLLVIVLSVLLWYTDSDYTYGIFWSLCCLFFFDIQILITPMASFGHCVVCSSLIYRFWLHLWHLLVIVLSVLLWYTDSDYTYGIFWSLCCLFFFDIQILITPMVSFGHCVVCSSLIYRFWLHLWYLLVIVLSVLLWYTDFDYTYGIFWSLCCLFFFDIQILITPMASFGHCVVCSSLIYRFWLHLWHLLVIVLSVLLWYTDSDYTYGIFWSLCCLFFFDIQILITPMASFGHCVVCSSLIYRFWLHLWYLLVIVLSVLLWYTDSDYTYGIFWSLCCLFFFDIQILITPMASFGHCVVCSSLIYRFWLHLWHLLVIVLSVLLWYTDSDYTYGIFWSLCCLFFFDIQILITPMVSFGHCVVCSSLIYRFWLHLWHLLVIVLSVLWYTDSDYTYGIFWSLCCLFFFDIQILITPMVSFGHCVVCSSLIYRFWLHLWYLLVIVLSVLLWYTDSDYTYGIFWSLCCLFFFVIQILITPMASFGHCVVCSSLIYRFWLHLWHLLVIVLSVLLWYTDSDYTYGIFWSLCCLFFFDIQILITPMASFGHCVVCSSLIYRFWLHLWHLLVIVLSVLLWYTDSDYTYGIFWSLCCLFFFDIQILITPMVSFGHCVVCSSLIYRFWLHLWHLLVIVLSVLLWYTDSDYTYGIFWSLCCLFFDIQILITPMASFGHCVVCSSLIYRFWLHLWHLLVIVLSVLLWYTDSDYTYGIFWSLCCLFFFDIQILITPMASFGHCVVCSSLIYRFWLHLWHLLVIVLSVLLWYTDSDYTYGIFWSLCCLFYFDIQILITPMASFGHCVVCSSLIYRFWLHLWYLLVIVLSVLLWYTDSDYTYGIFWSLCCLFFFDIQILITPMASFGHCVVCSSLIYRFWLHLWHLLVIVLSVLWYTDSDYTYGIFWSLCCLFFFDIQILITPMASFGHCVVCSSLIYRFWLHLWHLLVIVLSVLLWYTDSDYTYGIFWSLCCLFFFDIQILITPMVSFGHCVVCSSLIYRFWLHLWHLLVIVLSVLLWYTDSDYTYGIFWSLCCLFFFDIQILITPMASFGHCVVCSSLIYRFWLHLWHLLVIVLSVLLWYTDSDYTYGIFWSLCCLFFFDIQILITPMASFGHCVVCSSLIYRFWLHLWHLLVIVLSVLLWYTDSDYTYGIFWSLCCLFFFDIQILITPMVSFGHCVVCSSLIYRFWLHLWHLLVIVLSVLLWYTDSDYTYGIFWSLCCLFFFDIQILITPMVSFGHCVVCSSLIYRFWLHLWYLLVIVLSVLLWYTDSDYTYGIFWSLCCLFFFDIQILITPMASFGHCVVCSSLIYRFWLHLWHLLVIVLSVLLWYTDSDYTYGIFWSLCCLFFFDIQILITPMASFGHCVVCSSLIYRFWLHLWHLLVIVLSVLLWYTDSDYTYGIFTLIPKINTNLSFIQCQGS